MDMKAVGAQIAMLRRGKGLTQQELGERLGITFQAVSKWERGETLPDTVILIDLADVLESSVDHILTAGRKVLTYRGKVTVSQMADGLRALKHMGELLGKDNALYRCAVDGINTGMNTSVEDAFSDDRVFEAFLAEMIIQSLMAGKYVDLTDVRNGFADAHFRDIVLNYCTRYGIK